jgi:hypothetical protein
LSPWLRWISKLGSSTCMAWRLCAFNSMLQTCVTVHGTPAVLRTSYILLWTNWKNTISFFLDF